MTMSQADLSRDATYRLADLEAIIERGLETFVEVGTALLRIRFYRLYRDTHETFEAYCAERWGFTDRRARQLIEAAEVAETLPSGTMVPNERQARELAPLKDEPEQVREAWAEATERSDGKPTAAVVREVVRERIRSEAAESEAEITEATAHWSDEQRAAAAPERMRSRGELMRLTEDIAALPDPRAFAAEHGDLSPRVVEQAEAAHAWLTDFLSEWRHQHV